MATYSTRICTPAATAPAVTNEYARCQVCGAQWQIKSGNQDDAQGCSFCDAPKEAVTVINEAPDYSGAVIYEGRTA